MSLFWQRYSAVYHHNLLLEKEVADLEKENKRLIQLFNNVHKKIDYKLLPSFLKVKNIPVDTRSSSCPTAKSIKSRHHHLKKK